MNWEPSVPLRSVSRPPEGGRPRHDAARRDPAPPVPLRRGAKWYTFVLSFRIAGGNPTSASDGKGRGSRRAVFLAFRPE